MPASTDPHFGLEWFSLLAKTAQPEGARLALYPCSAEKSWEAFCPLMSLPETKGQLFGLANFYTPLFALVGEELADDRALKRLAEQLRTKPNAFYEVRFSPMDPESRSFALLKGGFNAGGWLVGEYFCFGNWYHRVEGSSYASYLASRPSRLRNTIQRSEKKLEKMPGYSLTITRSFENLEAAIADFVTVYNRSWKRPEPYPNFIPGLCQLAAEKSWLRLGIVKINQIPVAAQLWLVAHGKAHIVKLAYDKAFIKTSAGTVLSAALFRHVLDVDRVEEIDYLMGDDPYKKEWMSQRRERSGLIAFNPCFAKGLFGAFWHHGGKLKRRLFGKPGQ